MLFAVSRVCSVMASPHVFLIGGIVAKTPCQIREDVREQKLSDVIGDIFAQRISEKYNLRLKMFDIFNKMLNEMNEFLFTALARVVINIGFYHFGHLFITEVPNQ
jgi:hypothetical protein